MVGKLLYILSNCNQNQALQWQTERDLYSISVCNSFSEVDLSALIRIREGEEMVVEKLRCTV